MTLPPRSMPRPLLLIATAALAAGIAAPAPAGPVESACKRSDRPAATPATCACIGTLAERMLTRGDQRLAARLFRDPDQAQKIRQSDRRDHEEFWQRYAAFGRQAEASCG
ncbi:hypothetical protein [Frigidibacter oleivorans]|uniref:hypothetical protein n=1 Tax=Frigidibacter oleivorans TaxID=2487129 RepID=UPI001F30FD09|nr:hypothetical protein [Frigidibacter oleivorans]